MKRKRPHNLRPPSPHARAGEVRRAPRLCLRSRSLAPHARAGGILIIAILVITLMLTLVLTLVANMENRGALLADIVARQAARDTARSFIATALHQLNSDTNGVDSLDESWATSEVLPLADEESRINLNGAPPELIAALLMEATELTSAIANRRAQDIVAWRSAQRPPPETLESYLRAPWLDAALLARVAPLCTVHGTGLININTASPAVMRLLMEGQQGIAKDAQSRMLVALATSRRHGVVCEDTSPTTLARVFAGERSIPDTATAEAIAGLMPHLTTTSTCFRGRVGTLPQDGHISGGGVGTLPQRGIRSSRNKPSHIIEFVYNRENKSFLSWNE